MPVLAHQNDLVARRRRHDRDRGAMLDHVDALFASVSVAHVVDANLENASLEATA